MTTAQFAKLIITSLRTEEQLDRIRKRVMELPDDDERKKLLEHIKERRQMMKDGTLPPLPMPDNNRFLWRPEDIKVIKKGE